MANQQLNKAVHHILRRMQNDGRVAWLLGPGSETYDQLTAAFAAADGQELEKFRALYEPTLRPQPWSPHDGLSGENHPTARCGLRGVGRSARRPAQGPTPDAPVSRPRRPPHGHAERGHSTRRHPDAMTHVPHTNPDSQDKGDNGDPTAQVMEHTEDLPGDDLASSDEAATAEEDVITIEARPDGVPCPSGDQIVQAVANAFGVDYVIASSWLQSIDFNNITV